MSEIAVCAQQCQLWENGDSSEWALAWNSSVQCNLCIGEPDGRPWRWSLFSRVAPRTLDEMMLILKRTATWPLSTCNAAYLGWGLVAFIVCIYDLDICPATGTLDFTVFSDTLRTGELWTDRGFWACSPKISEKHICIPKIVAKHVFNLPFNPDYSQILDTIKVGL